MRSEMVDAIGNAMRSQVSELHVALPATIMGYDGSTGLCQVKPIGKVKKGDGQEMDYPAIAGIPMCTPSSIAVPIKNGQSCLLVICDADISGWLSGKTAVQSMAHSLQNAICIPEVRKTPGKLQQYANANNCVAIEGNLYVSGSITSVGNCNAPNIK